MKKIILLVLLTLLLPHCVYAQPKVDKAEYYGIGVNIADINSQDRILLYNVGKDMFLNAGGYWGTRTVTYTVGLPIYVIRQNVSKSLYRLRGPFSNDDTSDLTTGNYLGAVEKGGGDRGVYFDRGEVKNGLNWYFEVVKKEKVKFNGKEFTDYTYRIWMKIEHNNTTNEDTNPGLKNDYMLLANEPMTINVFKAGNNNLVRAMPKKDVTEDKKEYSYWKIVTTDQMIDNFSTTYTGVNPADASFLMRAQNFNRMNMYNYVEGENDDPGWHKKGTFNYEYGQPLIYDWRESGKVAYGEGSKVNHDNRYGMFYCGKITGGKKGEKLYQKVKVPKSGWYRVGCQGFFFNKTSPGKCFARLYAKRESQTDNYAYMDLLPRSYGEPYNGEALNITPEPAEGESEPLNSNRGFLTSSDGKVNNKIQAGIVFYEQLYPNHLPIYINFTEGEGLAETVELGIELTEDMTEGDLLFFDDFQLKYLGESFALDEGDEDFLGRGDVDETYENRVMILKRTLVKDAWNSICLPVDLTKSQLNTAFSPNFMLAKLRDSEHYGTIEFVTVDISNKGDNDVVLRKNECYLIKPGFAGRTDIGDMTVGDKDLTTVTAPYYTIDRVSLKENTGNIDASGEEKYQLLTKRQIAESIKDKGYTLFKIPDNTDVNGNVRKDDNGNVKDYFSVVGNLNDDDDIYNDCRLKVYGTFQKKTNKNGTDNRVPAHSYTFADGKLYHLSGNYTQKGFSCWIEDVHQTENPANVHKLNFATYIDGVSDGTTSIEGFTVDTRDERMPAVYTIHGQLVRKGTTSTEGLPHGIYVVNGKKILVR